MNLSEMRTRVRRDLHDEDASSYRWTDAELDRHIQHAVQEVSLASPLQSRACLYTTQGSRELSLSSMSNRIYVEMVEYPVAQYPPSYARFNIWGDTLTLLVDNAPQANEEVRVHYGKLHTLDATTSTLPTHLEDLVTTGAEGYAAQEWASFATNRVNVAGEDVWRHYLTWGQGRLAAFHNDLSRHSRKNAVRSRRLYTPAQPGANQSTDWGP